MTACSSGLVRLLEEYLPREVSKFADNHPAYWASEAEYLLARALRAAIAEPCCSECRARVALEVLRG